jgi:hypothetical protein
MISIIIITNASNSIILLISSRIHKIIGGYLNGNKKNVQPDWSVERSFLIFMEEKIVLVNSPYASIDALYIIADFC